MSRIAEVHTERAKQLLGHYFRTIAKQAGVKWDHDNDAEVEAIVDEIIYAAAATAIEDRQDAM